MVEKLDSLALNLASFSDYRLSLTITSSLFLLDQLYDHLNNFSLKTKNKFLLWDNSSMNIYNELALVWLSMNLPFNYQPIISKDLFKSAINYKNLNYEQLEIVDIFYEIASDLWQKLQNPTMNDLKNIILEIVAHVKINEVCKKVNINEISLVAQTLYEVIFFLVYEKKELVSEIGFVNICKIKLGQKWFECNLNEDCEADLREYYNFCKKFVLYDFPISNFKNNIIKAFFIYIRDCITRLKCYFARLYDSKTRALFGFVEEHLDAIYYASYNKYCLEMKKDNQITEFYNEFDEEINIKKPKNEIFNLIIEKTDNISNLISEYASFSLQSYWLTKKIDRFFGITQKVIATEILTDRFFNLLIELFYNNPIAKLMKNTKESMDNSLVVFIEKKKQFSLKSINFGMLKKIILEFSAFLFCYCYENPKYYIIAINKLCFISSPIFVQKMFLAMFKTAFKFKITQIKYQGIEIYKKTIEKIKKSNEILHEKFAEFNNEINERRKQKYPILLLEN